MNAEMRQEPHEETTIPFPHAVGPEKSILSSMLQDPLDYIALAIEEGLAEGHFYQPHHQTLYGFLRELYDAGIEIELVSLAQRLLDRGLLDRIGGPATLTDLYTYSPSPGHFRSHLGFVKEKAAARAMLNFCAETTREVHESPEEMERILDTAEGTIMAIREGRETMKVETIKDDVDWVIQDFQERLKGKVAIQGASTGFDELDRLTGGLKPGNMFVVAARPSMGKTSFMMNIVEHLGVDQQEPAMVFSCEMTRRELVQRLTYSRAKFDAGQLSRGLTPTKGDLQRIQRAALDIARSGLIIDDTPGITISQLRAKARRKMREKKIRLIAVDYLQLLKSTSRQATNSREREISEISAGLKGLAKELDIPIIVLAQLNRGPESRTGKKLGVPRMSDLRESGAIEQDADMVGLLYRRAYYAESDEDKEVAAGYAELILAKNRNGATGNVPLTFISQLSRFESGQPYPEPEQQQTFEKREWVR